MLHHQTLPLPLLGYRFCKQCKRGVVAEDVLELVTFGYEKLKTCPICDLNFC